jgi:uncharacterized membrane protein (UPF0127 family)
VPPRPERSLLTALAALVLLGACGDDGGTGPGVLAAALTAAQPASGDFAGLTEARVGLGERCLRVVVADASHERASGLRGRSELGRYDGMLFVNERDSSAAYTMQGVPVPLSIAWYDAGGALVDRAELVPCPDGDCPRYAANEAYRYALETLAGELPAGDVGACG